MLSTQQSGEDASLSRRPASIGHLSKRFKKSRFRKNRQNSPSSVLSEKSGPASVTSDVIASAVSSPITRASSLPRTSSLPRASSLSGTSPQWRRYGIRAPVLQSFLEDEPNLSKTLEVSKSIVPFHRAQSVPYSSRIVSEYRPSIPRPRPLPPFPISTLSASKLLNSFDNKNLQVSLPQFHSTSYLDEPLYSEYTPYSEEYEPDTKPLPRRRKRVLASSRRPAGNYYDRLLRKRGNRKGRLGAYYDVDSIEGSDLSGILSDSESLPDANVTYDTDVIPSYQRDSSPVDATASPYAVDEDTEYVPFKPVRSPQTKGLFELSFTDNDNDNEEYSEPLPSISRALSLPRPFSSLTSAPTSLPLLPYRSVVPFTPPPLNNSLAVESSSASQQLLDSLVASSVARARSALNSLALPNYHGTSLLLSVEGSGLGADGKRIGFTYTPAPIPLSGSSIGLEEPILSLKPTSTFKPVDDFLAGYMARMQDLRKRLTENLDKDRERRLKYGLKTLDAPSSFVPATRPSYKSYVQSHEYVPVKYTSSRSVEQVPVTTYRQRLDDGRTHRVDVFPLVVTKTGLPEVASRAIVLSDTDKGGKPYTLSVLDKINIKVTCSNSKTACSDTA